MKTMKYKFNEVFKENLDGTLSPIRQVMIGGVSFGPNLAFGPDARFASINFHQYKGHELEADNRDGVLVIKGIY